jgi:hypothetical protein
MDASRQERPMLWGMEGCKRFGERKRAGRGGSRRRGTSIGVGNGVNPAWQSTQDEGGGGNERELDIRDGDGPFPFTIAGYGILVVVGVVVTFSILVGDCKSGIRLPGRGRGW